jgi:hypothetical protein
MSSYRRMRCISCGTVMLAFLNGVPVETHKCCSRGSALEPVEGYHHSVDDLHREFPRFVKLVDHSAGIMATSSGVPFVDNSQVMNAANDIARWSRLKRWHPSYNTQSSDAGVIWAAATGPATSSS